MQRVEPVAAAVPDACEYAEQDAALAKQRAEEIERRAAELRAELRGLLNRMLIDALKQV